MAIEWETLHDYEDILYQGAEGIAKITINRPEVRNAFRPETLFELEDAFRRARDDASIGVIILTGAGDLAFCSGGDQRVRGDSGYVSGVGEGATGQGVGRFSTMRGCRLVFSSSRTTTFLISTPAPPSSNSPDS